MIFIRVKDSGILEYPIDIYKYMRKNYPYTIVPESDNYSFLKEYGIEEVIPVQPENRLFHVPVEGDPKYWKGKWYQTWTYQRYDIPRRGQT